MIYWMVSTVIIVIGFVLVIWLQHKQLDKVMSFIMSQKDSGAYAQASWKPWDTNDSSPVEKEERDMQDYMNLQTGMECDDKDIERFKETVGEIN